MPQIGPQGARAFHAWALALALLSAAPWCSPAAAEDVDPTALLGVWYRNDFNSLEIGRDRTTSVFGDRRWEESAEVCRGSFEHTFRHRRAADILERFLGPDFYDPEGEPLNDELRSALTADGYLTLTTVCCRPQEIGGGEEIIVIGEGRLLSVAWGDGVYEINRYYRTVPEPRHEDLSSQNRLDAQEALQRLSLYGGAIDGVFGAGTEAAIRAFQGTIGAEPTGVLSRSQFLRLVYGG